MYASGDVEKRGIWKVRPDGSSSTRLVAGVATLPEISPDATIVSYVSGSTGRKRSVRFVRLEDGAEIPLEIPAEGTGQNTGRHRWMPDGRALAIQIEDADGNRGVVIQDFVPGRDTRASRRVVAGFSPDFILESFGVSPDGGTLAVNAAEETSTLLLAEGVEGIEAKPVSRGGR